MTPLLFGWKLINHHHLIQQQIVFNLVEGAVHELYYRASLRGLHGGNCMITSDDRNCLYIQTDGTNEKPQTRVKKYYWEMI